MSNRTTAATQILRGMIFSLLEHGFTRQDVVAALGSLTTEAEGPAWPKKLASRERARGLSR
jgi:hypothetical protein